MLRCDGYFQVSPFRAERGQPVRFRASNLNTCRIRSCSAPFSVIQRYSALFRHKIPFSVPSVHSAHIGKSSQLKVNKAKYSPAKSPNLNSRPLSADLRDPTNGRLWTVIVGKCRLSKNPAEPRPRRVAHGISEKRPVNYDSCCKGAISLLETP